MAAHEIDPPIPPSVRFLYGPNGEVAGETGPLTGTIEEAFIRGEITTDEYLAQRAAEDAANQRLRDFMCGDKPPDFMPRTRRAHRWRGWLGSILRGA